MVSTNYKKQLKKMMDTTIKKITARVPSATVFWYEANFKSASAGAEFALKAFPQIIEPMILEACAQYSGEQIKSICALLSESDTPWSSDFLIDEKRIETIQLLLKLSPPQRIALKIHAQRLAISPG